MQDMTRYFPPEKRFHSLSVRDLLEARDAYHVYLTNMENVVATAIGRYRVRPTRENEMPRSPSEMGIDQHSKEKTLENTISPPWGWPCILVFVSRWMTIDQMKDKPDQVVPRHLYMPDGRMIPTCVIKVTRKLTRPPLLTNLNFPAELMGGGYPIITDVQGQRHVASIGCLVTDGDSIYGLTNKHVVGELIPGENPRVVSTYINGKEIPVGVAHYRHIGKKPFVDIFKGWPGTRVFSTLDAGLVRIADVNYWTAQVFGLGELGEPVDLHTDSISLDLIGCPVRAFGAASGEMVGEIQALFYRYKAVGGFDYVSDLLIGPLAGHPRLSTQPGDSGTIWCFDPELVADQKNKNKDKDVETEEYSSRIGLRRLRPLALQWGGHRMIGSSDSGVIEMSFALATSLSTICRELDVEVVRGWNIGLSEYWGKIGHYKIAAKACELVANAKLKLLMKLNRDVIAFDDETLTLGKRLAIDTSRFVPLADVPDFVWRRIRRKDEANHFADMDEIGMGEFEGKTLLQICEDPENVNIALWNRFYDSLGVNYKRGALPFRAWQLYNEMVRFVKQRALSKFVCAAGIVAHYVGDACQPLHVSYLHHGRPGMSEEKIHSYYETQMIDRFAAEFIAGVNSKLNGLSAKSDVLGGHQAAVSVVNLMANTVKKLPPAEIVEAYGDSQETSANNRLKNFFDGVGSQTISCLADGCLRLASIWESAWHEGNGDSIENNSIEVINKDDLQDLYLDKKFLEAFRLQEEGFQDALSQPV
jgi:hypothetical protein